MPILTSWPLYGALQTETQDSIDFENTAFYQRIKNKYLYLGIRIFKWRLSSAIRFIGELGRRTMKILRGKNIWSLNSITNERKNWSPVFVIRLQHPLPCSFHRLFHHARLVGHFLSLKEARVLLINSLAVTGPWFACIWWRSWTTLNKVCSKAIYGKSTEVNFRYSISWTLFQFEAHTHTGGKWEFFGKSFNLALAEDRAVQVGQWGNRPIVLLSPPRQPQPPLMLMAQRVSLLNDWV